VEPLNYINWKNGDLEISTGTKLYNRFFGHPAFQRINTELDLREKNLVYK